MNRDTRNQLMHGCLLLISRYDPKAGFSVGNAMQRNKLIYALADAALVVSSDLNKGGTWAGATEQLDKLKLVPIFVRSTGGPSTGLDALRAKGAMPWPNPQDVNAFKGIFGVAQPTNPRVRQADLSFRTVSPGSDMSVPGSTSSTVDHESARELVTHKSDEPTATGLASRCVESR